MRNNTKCTVCEMPELLTAPHPSTGLSGPCPQERLSPLPVALFIRLNDIIYLIMGFPFTLLHTDKSSPPGRVVFHSLQLSMLSRVSGTETVPAGI